MHLPIILSVLAVGLAMPQTSQSYIAPNRGSGNGAFGGQIRSGSQGGSGFQQSQENFGFQGSSEFQQSQGNTIDQRSQISSNFGQSQSQESYNGQESQGNFNGGQQIQERFNEVQQSQGNFNDDQQFQGGFDSGFSQPQRNFNGGQQQSQGDYDSGVQSQERFDNNFGQSNQGSCGENEIRHVDGSCYEPEIMRNFFLYDAPQRAAGRSQAPLNIPKPKVIHNIVFVRTPEIAAGLEPIIVPPPQHKTIVYVLNKNGDIAGQRIIEVPAGPVQKPEVYYVNYDDGSNPQLPIGIDLQTALASLQSKVARVIDAGAGSGSAGGNFGGNRGSFGQTDNKVNVGDFVRNVAQGGNQGSTNFGSNDRFQATIVTGNEGSGGFAFSAGSGNNNQGSFQGQRPSQQYGSP